MGNFNQGLRPPPVRETLSHFHTWWGKNTVCLHALLKAPPVATSPFCNPPPPLDECADKSMVPMFGSHSLSPHPSSTDPTQRCTSKWPGTVRGPPLLQSKMYHIGCSWRLSQYVFLSVCLSGYQSPTSFCPPFPVFIKFSSNNPA